MFGNTKKFYPVIHCVHPTQKSGLGIRHAKGQALIALENGADGVMLIGHTLSSDELIRIYDSVRSSCPKAWLGVNFLDLPASTHTNDIGTSLLGMRGVNGIWMDELPYRRLSNKDIQTFGGVAFKYINSDQNGEDLHQSCIKATQLVDVITTSGSATGSAPSIDKLENIRQFIGATPLALASGITEDNVRGFLATTDIFFVASSICKLSTEGVDDFIPSKVRTLAGIIHSYKQ
jgi:uncharacterized protein